MTAQEAYAKLYRGIKAEFDKWSDDELLEVYKLGLADPKPTPRIEEGLQAIRSEMDHRGTGELVQ